MAKNYLTDIDTGDGGDSVYQGFVTTDANIETIDNEIYDARSGEASLDAAITAAVAPINGTGNVNIDGGAIDGTTIGAAVPSTGAFTTIAGTSQALSAQPNFRAVLSAAQTLGNNVATTVQFADDSTSSFGWDTGTWFNTTTYTATVPASQGGVYFINAAIIVNGADGNRFYLDIYINDTLRKRTYHTNSGGSYQTVQVSDIHVLSATDTIYIKATSRDAADKVIDNDFGTFFSMAKLF